MLAKYGWWNRVKVNLFLLSINFSRLLINCIGLCKRKEMTPRQRKCHSDDWQLALICLRLLLVMLSQVTSGKPPPPEYGSTLMGCDKHHSFWTNFPFLDPCPYLACFWKLLLLKQSSTLLLSFASDFTSYYSRIAWSLLGSIYQNLTSGLPWRGDYNA